MFIGGRGITIEEIVGMLSTPCDAKAKPAQGLELQMCLTVPSANLPYCPQRQPKTRRSKVKKRTQELQNMRVESGETTAGLPQ